MILHGSRQTQAMSDPPALGEGFVGCEMSGTCGSAKGEAKKVLRRLEESGGVAQLWEEGEVRLPWGEGVVQRFRGEGVEEGYTVRGRLWPARMRRIACVVMCVAWD